MYQKVFFKMLNLIFNHFNIKRFHLFFIINLLTFLSLIILLKNLHLIVKKIVKDVITHSFGSNQIYFFSYPFTNWGKYVGC
jgi:hypothetical protein